jgi:hypothetical protein
MNNNDISQSILQSPETLKPATSSFFSTETSNGGFFESLKNINITTWFIIIILMAFLGFNVFAYLASGTQTITDTFNPILKKLFGITIAATSQAIDVSAEGAKKVVSATANAIESGLTAVQDITPNNASSSVKGQPLNQEQADTAQQNSLNQALNSAQSQNGNPDYEAAEASSSVYNTNKGGWCFVGQDRGFRTCAEVGANDTCMSGDIFPSREICMNPSLRA